ncbi:SET domain-containing protein-lysine N-methyltransferase [Sodalinema gerasimenkoae]|uniref:SET domain-containing protein-lysine N-methyltransferase n=1 Tax=Sodalinema gerasimenkoae TaxID=2862348 RepID=UPI001359955F|nr:SET domain-containing protein-lysine N-methyltransferase [Sodalinema gerasimenkoae]
MTMRVGTESVGTEIGVEVRAAGEKGKGVFALRPFEKGETVVVGRRVGVYPQRTIYSIQVDWDVHVEMDEPAIRINHSDTPTTGVQDNAWGAFDFVALREIAAGEEITFDYETTESELTDDFRACCPPRPEQASRNGFQSLPIAVREGYGKFVANYLKSDLGS